MPRPNDPNWGPSPLIGFGKSLEVQKREFDEAMQEVRLYNLQCAEAIGAMILHDLTVHRWKDVGYIKDGWNIFTKDGVFLACDADLIDALKAANARIAAKQAEDAQRRQQEVVESIRKLDEEKEKDYEDYNGEESR
jgi:hypothetical protein